MNLRFVSFLLLAAAAHAVTIPAGTQLQVRLLTEVSSDKSSGQPVSAVVVVPVFLSGIPVISAGTRLTGNTADVNPFHAATEQAIEQSAKLRIQFTSLEDQAGHTKHLDCVLESVDNARETVDASGLINGIAASETFEARIEQGINKLGSKYQGFAQLLSGIEGALVKPVNASIDYKPGVDLTIKLTKALEWNWPATSIAVEPIAPADALTQIVNSEPFRTVAQKPPSPSDMTNLMFIGTTEAVQKAFQEAGWFPADRLSNTATLETARALIENRGYSEAPMSILFLDGQPPSFALQKQNNTFAMRHHIRIWLRPQLFKGKPVWVAAATHDISITLSPVSRSFTHAIDPDIDKERAKVVNDLLFTGEVHGLALVDRAGIPKDATNATGDKLETDGRMAVLEF